MCLFVIFMFSVALGDRVIVPKHDYSDALSKSILFFEGQRSGKLPYTQRMTWRKDSALHDGDQIGVDLVGGYYDAGQWRSYMEATWGTGPRVPQVSKIPGSAPDAGDNVKFNFPMAFSTTMLAWSVLESGRFMGPDLKHALDAIRWGTDYFLKATSIPGLVFVQVGDPYGDHSCWQRPEDMDTPRTPYAVSKDRPGSEVAAEIAAALAASSIVFRTYDVAYSIILLRRAIEVFNFADKYRGSYNDSLRPWVCPFYCDYSGYQDELMWGAAWLHRATNSEVYWRYLVQNIHNMESSGNYAEFGWDSKYAGINVLLSKLLLLGGGYHVDPFHTFADKFVCSILPESPTRCIDYSPGGLLFKPGGSNMQHTTALSFLLLVYARYLGHANEVIRCGNVVVTPPRLIQFAKGQVDYILGSNPMNMSYMVGYGKNFPRKLHHRGASIQSLNRHPDHIDCKGGSPYYSSNNPDPNLLTGAVVGGPDIHDSYADSRQQFVQSEPTTYINAPLVGLLAYFKTHPV